jgi:predicted dehydrogenase
MHSSRRHFLKTTAAATLGFPAIVRALNQNSKGQIAGVGCSGKGLSDITEIGSHPQAKYVAFADADTSKFEVAARKWPVAQQFQDWREMFAKLGDKFDAISCSTPDHMHAPVSMAAMRMGKHVYCQKPLSHTIWEARQMRLLAEKKGVITQLGNQIHSAKEYRTGVKLIQSGVIGKIKAVHSLQNKPGNAYNHLTGELPPPSNPPETLNWDLWIGPAPMRPYADAYHPAKWRDFLDFGGGVLGDFGCHIMDPVFNALKLTAPISIRAENDGVNPQCWPAGETVYYVFPGTEYTADKTLPLTWHDGGHPLPVELTPLMPKGGKPFGAGSIFIGETGAIMLPHVGMPQLLPVERYTSHEIEVVPGESHYHLWVDGIIKNEKTDDGFHYGGPLTEAVHLGNIATRLPGQTLEWDAPNMKITNNEEAQKLVTKKYREGWEIQPA